MMLTVKYSELKKEAEHVKISIILVGGVYGMIADNSDKKQIEVSGSPREIIIALKLIKKFLRK